MKRNLSLDLLVVDECAIRRSEIDDKVIEIDVDDFCVVTRNRIFGKQDVIVCCSPNRVRCLGQHKLFAGEFIAYANEFISTFVARNDLSFEDILSGIHLFLIFVFQIERVLANANLRAIFDLSLILNQCTVDEHAIGAPQIGDVTFVIGNEDARVRARDRIRRQNDVVSVDASDGVTSVIERYFSGRPPMAVFYDKCIHKPLLRIYGLKIDGSSAIPPRSSSR